MGAHILQVALRCSCPKCYEGDIYKGRFSLELKSVCSSCGLDLESNDNADGPAVIMMFILGFLIVPLALWVDHVWWFPVWVHAFVWGGVTLGLILLMFRPIKAYVMALQYRHRPDDWTV